MKVFKLTDACLWLLIAAMSGFASGVTAAPGVPVTPAPATDLSGPLHVKPIHTTHPEAFSGISGPGHPVVGDGYGGYRTGREGTMYAGVDPAKPGWLPLGNRALGTAVKNGIILMSAIGIVVKAFQSE